MNEAFLAWIEAWMRYSIFMRASAKAGDMRVASRREGMLHQELKAQLEVAASEAECESSDEWRAIYGRFGDFCYGNVQNSEINRILEEGP